MKYKSERVDEFNSMIEEVKEVSHGKFHVRTMTENVETEDLTHYSARYPIPTSRRFSLEIDVYGDITDITDSLRLLANFKNVFTESMTKRLYENFGETFLVAASQDKDAIVIKDDKTMISLEDYYKDFKEQYKLLYI